MPHLQQLQVLCYWPHVSIIGCTKIQTMRTAANTDPVSNMLCCFDYADNTADADESCTARVS